MLDSTFFVVKMVYFLIGEFLLSVLEKRQCCRQCCGAVPFWPGSRSGSSSSPVVHNLLLKKSFLKINFHLSITGACSIQRKCLALLFEYFN